MFASLVLHVWCIHVWPVAAAAEHRTLGRDPTRSLGAYALVEQRIRRAIYCGVYNVGPLVISWFITPPNYCELFTIHPSYCNCSYKPT